MSSCATPTYVTAKDLYEVPRLATQAVLAWTLPEPAWWPLTRRLGHIYVALHPARSEKQIALIRALLAGTHLANDAHRIAVEVIANRYEERFQYLRAWRPGGWSPNIDVGGETHIWAALNRGRGIVLWGSSFTFNPLLAKMAMHRLRLKVSGFAVTRHGFSDTRFGVAYLNRVCRDIEDRYLGERVMTAPADFPVALQHMRERLTANGVVHFAVGGRGRRTASARFLGDRIFVATGPVAMAHATGAALLPIYTLRIAPGHFEVTIGSPITVPEIDGDPDCAAAVQDYADRLKLFVLRDPGQWRGWQMKNPMEPWGAHHE